MSGQIRLDRSVLQAQIEAEQMQYEGIIYSVALHIFIFVVSLNFNLIEKHFDLKSARKKIKPVQVEITLIDLESAAGSAAGQATNINLEQNVSTAPELERREEQVTVKMTDEKTDVKELSQTSVAPVKNPTDEKGEINQLTKESPKVSSVNQAEIQMKLLRERQKRVQMEIDQARIQRERALEARQIASDGVSNLVEEESGVALVSPEKFQQFMNSSPSGDSLFGDSSEFVVNINQVSAAEGQEPCPADKKYYNPANECRPYTQVLYKPLCYYEYDECVVLMRKYKIKMGITSPNEK